MSFAQGHRKTIRHYDESGDCHELTFSSYHRLPLLTNDNWRQMFSVSIDRATAKHRFALVAFVYMPEHVHLLVYPTDERCRVEDLLKAIKQPFSNRMRMALEATDSRLLQRLTVRERPGKMAFRFWQEGPGYDRNLMEPGTVAASVYYIHLNPVRRGLVREANQWRWSSCRFYISDGQDVDPALPAIRPLPAEFWLK